jgi:hypothetical protein
MPFSSSRIRAVALPAAALALLAGAALARPAPSPGSAEATHSPFFGTWQLETDQISGDPGRRPQHVTYTFGYAGAGQWRTKIDITDPDGRVHHTQVQYFRDGSVAQGEGDTSVADSAAMRSPAPNVLVMSLTKNKAFGSAHTYAVSSDGQEMTETAAGIDDAGKPYVSAFHFKRVS